MDKVILLNEARRKSCKMFVNISGFPAIIVAMSLSIAAGKDGIQSFVSDK